MVKVLALIAAIALHALIILALLFGVRLPKPEPAPAPPVQARLVSPVEPSSPPAAVPTPPEPTPAAPQPAPQPPRPEPAPKPTPEPTPPSPAPRPAPKPAEKPAPKPAPKPVEKPAAKPAKPDDSVARQRALQAELAEKAHAEQARQKAERERAERLRAQMAADELRQRLARETAASAPAPRPAEDASALISRYKGEIRDRVRRYWSSDALRPGLSTAVRVRLDTKGNVLTVSTVRSSGNRDFDQAVEAAVMRASPLPIPNRPDLYQEFREIDFTFSAKDFDNA
ncbi:cell envelope integrity protein TolA [Thermithiobacillus plumbiphilus]|uniref:Cell envelope integrity protein TolA n=1 Tax=Thermithiobacillus plumbiphilus TaxID=1729899 RepID=A0ABU9D6A2_9PROT